MASALGAIFVDVKTLPETGAGFVQILFLGAVYAYVLFQGSNLISDGSELLLLVPSLAGLVGSVVLPILGAVPDGAIVLFSGLGPNAQEQVTVGVGALAGSTIMLLTIPWALSIYAGRVDLDSNGRGNYLKPKGAPDTWEKLSPGRGGLRRTGVNVNSPNNLAVRNGGKIMVLTAIPYLIIQGASFAEHCGEVGESSCDPSGQTTWSGIGLIFSVVAFVGYLWYCIKSSQDTAHQDRNAEIVEKHMRVGDINIIQAYHSMQSNTNQTVTEEGGLLGRSKALNYWKKILLKMFTQYDTSRDGLISRDELALLFKDMGLKHDSSLVEEMMVIMDSDGNGFIDFPEFGKAMERLAKGEFDDKLSKAHHNKDAGKSPAKLDAKDIEDDDEEDEDEEEDVPEDLVDLSPAEQQKRIKMRSAWQMTVGTMMVLLFSDPMCDVLGEVGARIGVPAFYVSFVLAPLASNAAEVIASYSYAQKKTRKSMTISFSALIGAGNMNNTFCLGIFLALCYFKGLVWEFAAETIAIFAVEVVMMFMAYKQTHTLFDACLTLSLYPLSLLLVAMLEKAGLN